jgi:hypothetical protein
MYLVEKWRHWALRNSMAAEWIPPRSEFYCGGNPYDLQRKSLQNHNLRRDSLLQNYYSLRNPSLQSQSLCRIIICGTNPSADAELLFVVRIPLRNYYLWYESLCRIITCGVNPPLRHYYLWYESLCRIIFCGTNPSAEPWFAEWILQN